MQLSIEDEVLSIQGEVVYYAAVAKIDVIEERLNNQIWLLRLAAGTAAAWLIYLTFAFNGIQGRLSGIEASQKQILTTQTLQRSIFANPSEVPHAMESAQKAITTATSEHIKVDPQLAIDVAKKAIEVTQHQSDPSVQTTAWRTFGVAVNYASSQKSPVSNPLSNNPSCMEKLLTYDLFGVGGPGAILVPESKILRVPTKQFLKGCVLDLDGAYTSPRLKGVILEFIQPLNLEDCLIIYDGGRPLLAGELIFKNCTFLIKIDTPPPPAGQQFAGTLVGSDLVSAQIPIPSAGS